MGEALHRWRRGDTAQRLIYCFFSPRRATRLSFANASTPGRSISIDTSPPNTLSSVITTASLAAKPSRDGQSFLLHSFFLPRTDPINRDILKRHEQGHVKQAKLIAEGGLPTKKPKTTAGPKLKKGKPLKTGPPVSLSRAVRKISKACDRCCKSKSVSLLPFRREEGMLIWYDRLRCDADVDDVATDSACARCLRAGFDCTFVRVEKKPSLSRSASSSAVVTRDNSSAEDDDLDELEDDEDLLPLADDGDDDYKEDGDDSDELEEEEQVVIPPPVQLYQPQAPIDRRPAPYLPPHNLYASLDPTWQQQRSPYAPAPDNFYSTSNAIQSSYPLSFANVPRPSHYQAQPIPQAYYPEFFPNAPLYPQAMQQSPYGMQQPYAPPTNLHDIAQIAQSLSDLAHETAKTSNLDWSVLADHPFAPDMTLEGLEGLDDRRESMGSINGNGTRSHFVNSAAESLLSLARF